MANFFKSRLFFISLVVVMYIRPQGLLGRR